MFAFLSPADGNVDDDIDGNIDGDTDTSELGENSMREQYERTV